MTDLLVSAVRHLCTYGPVGAGSGRPCAHDVRELLSIDYSILVYPALHALADAGELIEHIEAEMAAIPTFSAPIKWVLPVETTTKRKVTA